MHLVCLLGEAADRCHPAFQLFLPVEIAEALGGADVRLLVGLGVVAVNRTTASGLVVATTGGVDERKPCGSSTTT